MWRGRGPVLALLTLLLACTAPTERPGPSSGRPDAGVAGDASSAAVATTVALERVHLAYTTTNAATTPMWLAQDAGLFQEQGLETTLVRIPAGAPLLAALQN